MVHPALAASCVLIYKIYILMSALRPYLQAKSLGLFLICLCAWIVAGGIMLSLEEDRSLFRFFNGLHTPFLDRVMPALTTLGEGVFIVCALSALLLLKRYRNWRFFLLMAGCILTPFLVVQGLKNIFVAPRPIAYFDQASWIHIVEGQTVHRSLSFPSGHTAGIFSAICFFSFVLPRRYAPVIVILFLLGLAVGISRMYLAQHFFSDVYAGSLISVAVTLLVFSLLQRRLKVGL